MVPFLIVLGVCALVAIVAFIIYRILNPKMKKEAPTEEDKAKYVQEELDRYLQPVEDEEIAKKISDYQDEEE